MRLGQRALLLVGIPAVVDFAFVILLATLLLAAEKEIQKEYHAKEVISETNVLMKGLYDATFSLGVYAFSRDPKYMEQFELAKMSELDQLSRLEKLLKNDATEVETYNRLKTSVSNLIIAQDKNRKKMIERNGTNFLGVSTVNAVNQLMDTIKSTVDYYRKIEEEAPKLRDGTRSLIVQSLVGGLLFNFLAVVLLTIYFNRGTTRRLNVLVENTERLVKKEQLCPSVGGNDEITQLDTVFHDMADKLDKADKHRQGLISMVSHDLRTPLTSVQVSLELMTEGVHGTLSEKAQNEAEIASYNISRMIHLINDLLCVEQIQGSSLTVRKAKVEMIALFDVLERTLAPFAKSKNISIVAEDVYGVSAHLDEERIMQVLSNFVSNAVKFSPEGSTITLGATDDGAYIRVFVKDQGRGVPQEHRARIFEKFQQVKDEDRSNMHGSGLGLAISKMIVEAHGGTIGVDSNDGQGSCFWFTVPK